MGKYINTDQWSIIEDADALAINTLIFFSWFYLLCSIGAALYVFVSFSQKDIVSVLSGVVIRTELDPVWIGIGVGIVLQGILTCIVLKVFSSMAKNLIIIRLNTRPNTEKPLQKGIPPEINQ